MALKEQGPVSWEKLVESQRQQGGSPSSGAVCKTVVTFAQTPRQGYLLSKDRQITRIPSLLKKVIGEVSAGRASWPLFIHGNVGTGKTSAALCMVDHVNGAIYHRFEELAVRLIEASKGLLTYPVSHNRVYPFHLWDEIERAPLTVLDEVGLKDKANDWQYEVMLTYLQKREGKPFVIIGNCNLEGVVESFDYRVASRLSCATTIHCGWDDLRPQPADNHE